MEVRLDSSSNRLVLLVADNGRGMSRAAAARAADPFYTSRVTRRVGLGLSLLQAAAERCGGWLRIESEPGAGTTIRAQFEMDHPDRAPLGDLAGTILGLIACNPGVELELRAAWNGGEYDFSTTSCRDVLGGDLPLDDPDVLNFIRRHLAEGLSGLKLMDNG